jgi:hypothetical protein
MSPYMGGSAPGMAEQITEGNIILSPVQLKRLTDPELDQLQFEVEKRLRELRGEAVPQDNSQAMQARSRKLMRLSGAIQQIQATRAKRKRRV